uniref:Uncharacterized protein n=1 Tax=Romanomermis culicivorax TaxID=13658 RepID=A0A915K1F0_ROMCU
MVTEVKAFDDWDRLAKKIKAASDYNARLITSKRVTFLELVNGATTTAVVSDGTYLMTSNIDLIGFQFSCVRDCVAGGRQCHLADRSGWPTVPGGRLYHMAECSTWPTVPGGRIQLDSLYPKTINKIC